MKAWQVVVAAQRLLAWVVLAISATYLLVYLYRWEWNRAIISGVFFVAAEVALMGASIHRRLRAIEQHVAAGQPSEPDALAHLRSTPVDRPDPFAWLREQEGRLGVFVPVLLGAGVILSALAYVVQRVAEVTAVPVADRRLAQRLAAIELPPGGLTGPRPAGSDAPSAGSPRRRPGSPVIGVVTLAAAVVLGWLGVDTLMDATQTRADPADRPAATTIEMDVAQRGTGEDPVDAAEALWVGCRSTLGSQPVDARVVGLAGDRVALVLEPGIGRLTSRRLTGCLSDLRVNLVIAHVKAVEHTAD